MDQIPMVLHQTTLLLLYYYLSMLKVKFNYYLYIHKHKLVYYLNHLLKNMFVQLMQLLMLDLY